MKKSRGHVSVEWTIITLVMLVALFAPVIGSDPSQSVVGLMMESIKNYSEHGSFLYSLP